MQHTAALYESRSKYKAVSHRVTKRLLKKEMHEDRRLKGRNLWKFSEDLMKEILKR